MERMERIREVLKERVCGVCFDRNDDSTCGLPADRVCAIEAHLPEIVSAIESEHSFNLTPYVEGLRTKVCPNCSQDAEGHCAFRESFDCSVDNFIYLIVDTIESENAKARGGSEESV